MYIKLLFKFSVCSRDIFKLFWFSIYKMFDSKCRADDYKCSKISIGPVMKNPEMLKFVFDHLKL